jgi:hypothetical protein
MISELGLILDRFTNRFKRIYGIYNSYHQLETHYILKRPFKIKLGHRIT